MSTYRFTFTTTLERAESDIEVKVTARSESYAAAVGFPNEPCRQREVTITAIESNTQLGAPPISKDELEFLQSMAVDQLCFR